MLTRGEQGLRQRWAIFKAVDQFTVSRMRNRLRIGRLYGVNGHRQQSHGRKAGILSDQLVKANDCQQKKIRKSAAAGTFSTPHQEKKLHFLRWWLMTSANQPG
jgi:hypothetical protein